LEIKLICQRWVVISFVHICDIWCRTYIMFCFLFSFVTFHLVDMLLVFIWILTGIICLAVAQQWYNISYEKLQFIRT
jgi:hypothetical protein